MLSQAVRMLELAHVRYRCDECDYKATTKGSFFRHIKSRHEGVTFPCDQCDYKATEKASLLKHIKSKHLGIKFHCDQCDFKTSWEKSFLRHVKSKHKGDEVCTDNRRQYMFFHCGMIHSILEQSIPVWNESFQSGMNHSMVLPEIGYESYSQNSGLLYVSRI